MSDVIDSLNQFVITVQSVDFSYIRRDGSFLTVLKNLNLKVEYGEIVGLVGRNGVGKTTVLEVLRGTLVPQKGEIWVGRTLVASRGSHHQKPSVALISQRPDEGLNPTMTVYENFAIATGHKRPALQWAYSSRMKDACRDLMERAGMGIEDKCHEQTRFLSLGQQQAVSVLLALEAPEHLLLMDEPTAALDPFAAQRLLDLAFTEVERVHGAVLLVSHRLADVTERCSRIFVLSEGTITRNIVNCSGARVTEGELLEAIS
jgi:putative ABC transport system ATP-binding protein